MKRKIGGYRRNIKTRIVLAFAVRETVELPFGTIKARMGATHFPMKTLPRLLPRWPCTYWPTTSRASRTSWASNRAFSHYQDPRKASRGASVCQSGSEIESGSRLWRSRADMRLQPFYFPTIAISTFPIARASVIVKRS
jgi:hypothetical protein